MKISIPRARLVGALERAERSAAKGDTIPILKNVRLTATGDGRLEIEATDLRILYRVILDGVSVERSGTTTIGARALLGLAKRMAGAEVDISVDEEGRSARIASGRSRYDLPVLPSSDYGVIEPPPGDCARVEIWPDAFVACVDQVAFAVSTEETRQYLTGIYMTNEGGALRCVATDGHRIAFSKSPSEHAEVDGMFGAIVPARTAATISDMVKKRDARVVLRVSEDKISAEIAGDGMREQVVSVLIDGIFPDWRRLVMGRRRVAARIARADFRGAIDCIMVVAGGETNAVRLRADSGSLVVLSWSQGNGAGREEVAATRLDDLEAGADIRVEDTAANGRYISSILDAVDVADEVEMSFDGAGSPIVFAAVGVDDWGVTLMPIGLDKIVTREVA